MPKIGVRTYVTGLLVTGAVASVFVPTEFINATSADKLWLAVATVVTYFFTTKGTTNGGA